MPCFTLRGDWGTTINILLKKLSCIGYNFLFALVCFVALWGCATVPPEDDVVARVDGEIITVADLLYSLNVSHRLEDLSSAGQMDMSGFIEKLVDELLIVQEARRMGIENDPEMLKKADSYVLRESVVRLYNDEILEKSLVSDAEIRKHFRHDYERFIINMIAAVSQEEAAAILARLKSGEDFGKLARENVVDYSRDGGEITLKRKDLAPMLEKVVLDMSAGEVSNVINIEDKFFYIVMLIKRQEAAEEEFELVSKKIKGQLSISKREKRSDEYLAELRTEADIEIDQEVLNSLNLGKKESKINTLKDERVLAKVNDNVLMAGDFAAKLLPSQVALREKVLNNWIDVLVVNDEALSRQYELRSNLKDELWRYKRQLIKNLFSNRVIVPGISISNEQMEDYYVKHKEDFVKPSKYRIQRITLKTIEDARAILNSMNDGASFSWLAKRKSKDELALKGGAAGWVTKTDLSESEAGIIDTLKPGEISPVLEVDNNFMVIRLQENSEPVFEEFELVKQMIQERIFREEYKKIYREYVDQLKMDANIEIYEEVIKSFKAKFRK